MNVNYEDIRSCVKVVLLWKIQTAVGLLHQSPARSRSTLEKIRTACFHLYCLHFYCSSSRQLYDLGSSGADESHKVMGRNHGGKGG